MKHFKFGALKHGHLIFSTLFTHPNFSTFTSLFLPTYLTHSFTSASHLLHLTRTSSQCHSSLVSFSLHFGHLHSFSPTLSSQTRRLHLTHPSSPPHSHILSTSLYHPLYLTLPSYPHHPLIHPIFNSCH